MNVITLVCDTLRRDHLGCYGNSWIHTPNFDKLAGMSTVFDRAYLHNFPTVPARCDMWTGRYSAAYFDWGPLPREETILSQTLSDDGVTTMLIGDTGNLFRDNYFFSRGFDAFHWIRGQVADRYQTAPIDIDVSDVADVSFDMTADLVGYLRSANDRRYEEEFLPAETFRDAIRWLEMNRKWDRFYLHLDIFDPHEPWDPPQWYVDRYDSGYEGREIIFPLYAAADYLTPAELNHCRALYAGEVSLVDTWLGRFMVSLENMGLLDNTAIILASDHGFYLGEHNWMGKTSIQKGLHRFVPLYEEVAHVPQIVYLPGAKPGRSDALVQPVDMAPTVLDLMGVPTPETMQGSSWMPVLRGEVNSVRDFAWSGPPVHNRGKYRPSTITTNEGWSMIHNGMVEPPAGDRPLYAVDGKVREEILPASLPDTELYYLPDDPHQQRNLFHERREVAEDIHRRFIKFLEELNVPEAALELRRQL